MSVCVLDICGTRASKQEHNTSLECSSPSSLLPPRASDKKSRVQTCKRPRMRIPSQPPALSTTCMACTPSALPPQIVPARGDGRGRRCLWCLVLLARVFFSAIFIMALAQ